MSISKKGQFIQPHATSVLSWDFVILGSEFCEMSFTDGACRQCFIQSLQLKTIAFIFLYAVKPPKMQRFRVRHLGLISTVA